MLVRLLPLSYQKMRDLVEADDFNPKKICDDLIKRCKKAKVWYIYCYVDEEWMPRGEQLPFDLIIKDGIFACRVVCPSYNEAKTIVGNVLPVIKFIEEPGE